MSNRPVPPGAARTNAAWFWAATAWAAVGLLYALLLSSSWVTPDIFYHLELGRRVLAGGGFQPPEPTCVTQPGFVNFYWLFQVVVQPLYASGGAALVGWFLVLAGLAAAWTSFDTAGYFRRPAPGRPLALAAVLILQHRVDPRPEALSFLFLALLVRWLTLWEFSRGLGAGRVALVGLVTVAWTNLHGYFAFAPLLVGLRLLESLAARRGAAERRSLILLLLVTAVATFVSPFGAGAWRGVFALWGTLSALGGEILEFGPPTGLFLRQWTVWVFWAAWVAVLGLLIHAMIRRRLSIFELGTAAAGLYLSAGAARNMPLLVFLAAPLVGTTLAIGDGASMARGKGRWRMGVWPLVPTAVAFLLCGWVVQGGFHRSLRLETGLGPRLEPHAYPVAAVDFLRRLPGEGSPGEAGFAGTIFNSAADGGYLAYELPGVRPYMDSRYVDLAPVQTYFAALRDPEAFDLLDRKHRFNGVMLKVADSPDLARALLSRGEWRMLYADLHRVVLVRRAGPWGSSAPAAARIYQGEDLGRLVNGRAAIEWMRVLVSLGRRELVLAALSDFGRASGIPSFVLQYPLEAAGRAGDGEMVERIRALRPRMISLRPEDARTVDRLLDTESRGGGDR